MVVEGSGLSPDPVFVLFVFDCVRVEFLWLSDVGDVEEGDFDFLVVSSDADDVGVVIGVEVG